MRRAVAVLATLALLGAGSAAWAKPGQGNGNGKGGPHGQGYDDDSGPEGHGHGHDHESGGHFSAHERAAVQGWYAEQYGRGHCPPGLAKKHNGCLPPGHAKKRYQVGVVLPAAVVVAPVPVGLAVTIGPPPIGYRYGMVDGDVVELAVGTMMVVDAIQGLASH
jgi:hypothetical protein